MSFSVNGFSLFNPTPNQLNGVASGADITYVNSTAGDTSVTLPAGTADGDLMLWFGGYDTPNNITIPTGFTIIDQVKNDVFNITSAYKIASSEVGPYIASFTTSSIILVARKSGGTWTIPTTLAQLHSEHTEGNTGTSITSGEVTPLSTKDMHVVGFHSDGGEIVSVSPDGMTLAKDKVNSSWRTTVYYEENIGILTPVTATLQYTSNDDMGVHAVIVHAE